jgi:hypothetical protein
MKSRVYTSAVMLALIAMALAAIGGGGRFP